MPDTRYSDAAILATIQAADEQGVPILACGKAAYLRLTPQEQTAINRSLRGITEVLRNVGPVMGLEILTAIAIKREQKEDMDNGND